MATVRAVQRCKYRAVRGCVSVYGIPPFASKVSDTFSRSVNIVSMECNGKLIIAKSITIKVGEVTVVYKVMAFLSESGECVARGHRRYVACSVVGAGAAHVDVRD